VRDGPYAVDASLLRAELAVLRKHCEELQDSLTYLRDFRQYLASSIFDFDPMEPYPEPSLMGEVSDDICRLTNRRQRLVRNCARIEKRLKGLDDRPTESN